MQALERLKSLTQEMQEEATKTESSVPPSARLERTTSTASADSVDSELAACRDMSAEQLEEAFQEAAKNLTDQCDEGIEEEEEPEEEEETAYEPEVPAVNWTLEDWSTLEVTAYLISNLLESRFQSSVLARNTVKWAKVAKEEGGNQGDDDHPLRGVVEEQIQSWDGLISKIGSPPVMRGKLNPALMTQLQLKVMTLLRTLHKFDGEISAQNLSTKILADDLPIMVATLRHILTYLALQNKKLDRVRVANRVEKLLKVMVCKLPPSAAEEIEALRIISGSKANMLKTAWLAEKVLPASKYNAGKVKNTQDANDLLTHSMRRYMDVVATFCVSSN